MTLVKFIVIGFAVNLIFLMCGPLSAKPRIIFDTDMDPDRLDTASSRPHIPRQGKNLVPNPIAKTASTWSLIGNATYDPKTSRTSGSSGSFRLITPYYDKERRY